MMDYVYLVTTTVTTGPELDEFVTGYTRVYYDIDGASAAVAAVITEWFPDGIGSPAQRPLGRDQAPSRWGVYEHLTQDLGIADYDLGAEILAGSIDSSSDTFAGKGTAQPHPRAAVSARAGLSIGAYSREKPRLRKQSRLGFGRASKERASLSGRSAR